jgi:two-component system nitrate/nitrite response regulator NarL
MEPLRILLVDDHILFRKGVKSLLASREDMEVVGEAGDGLEAIARTRETLPDVVLMDIGMPTCSGLEAVKVIAREMPHVCVIMLTVSDDDKDLFEAIRNGAAGYLLKDLEPQQLHDILQGVRRGEAPITAPLAAKILREFRQPVPSTGQGYPATEALTAREMEVLGRVVEGDTNPEIAEALSITENTVKIHLHNILEKLHLRNRVQAAVYAIREGLVDTPSSFP